MEKEIYVVLTQTSSVLSRMIKIFTRAEFNHSSLSLSPDLDPMWSFGRRHPYNPFWGGFVKEYLYQGTFYRFPKTRCAVYRISVDEAVYEHLSAELERMYREKDHYHYDFIGLCLAALRISYQRPRCFYCSEFIRTLFVTCGVPESDCLPPITEPCDLIRLPGTELVYRGLLRDYSSVSHTSALRSSQ